MKTKGKYEGFTENTESPLKFVGKHRVIRVKNNEIVWTLGPHWPCFAGMFIFMIVGAILNIIYISPKFSNPALMIIISLIISTIELILYFSTSLTNPGILLPQTCSLDMELGQRCQKCHAIKLQGSHHCNDCDVCIRDWDHHCVWTGKCIGRNNISFFWGFLAWTVLFLSYQMATTLCVYKQL